MTAEMADAAKYITQFDSSSSMLYALGNALKEKPFKGAGVVPNGFGFVPALLNFLPFSFRQKIYRWSGGWTALDPGRLGAIRAEEISDWVIRQYPRRRYPAILIGSSDGAAIHLGAAMRIPWLPQTFLAAVRRRLDPDEIEADIEWGRRQAPIIRKNNPELRIHQMHDPVQDRLMIARMGYFRMKRLRLGRVYERFILENLEPGGTLLVLDDRLRWPMMSVAEEHTFQVGGLGGLGAYEYLEGSPRVEAFLHAQRSSKKCWPLPGEVYEGPESEWGFYPSLGEDVERFARANGYRARRITFDSPEALSPWVADLYRWWYEKKGIPARRLLAECFALLEPWLALRTGSVPFWLAFNTRPSLEALESYLKKNPVFDEIYLMLMSNGVCGVDLVPIEAWKTVLNFARKRGEFLGVNEQKYPLDFTSFVRYHAELKRKVAERFDPSAPLFLDEIGRFAREAEGRYPVRWEYSV